MFPFISHLIGGAVGSYVLLSLAIILGSFLLEEVTIVIVGILAASGAIPIPLALCSLYTGIIICDTGLYSLGWLASTHPRLAKYVDHDLVAPMRTWLETRFDYFKTKSDTVQTPTATDLGNVERASKPIP